MNRFLRCSKKLLTSRTTFRIPVRHQGYIVLIPEIGEDLPGKNPLLQQNGLPEFNNITIENCMAAIGKQTLEFESEIQEIEKKLQKNPDSDVFKDVIDPLEIEGTPLDMTWGLSKTLYLGHSTKMPTKNYLAIHERAKRARATKFNSKKIFEAVLQEVENPGKNRTEEQRRIIRKFALEGKLNGLALEKSKKSQLTEVLNKISKERTDFKVKIEAATSRFSHIVDDMGIIKLLPDHVLNVLNKNANGFTVNLQPQVCIPFMEYCPDRMTRWNIWQAMVGRGGGYNKRDHETSTNLEQIRSLRHDEANILGYESYAAMSMETKMAGSVNNVNNMLATLAQNAFPVQERELQNLYNFAKERGFEGDQIQLWDLPYWRRKQRKTLFEYDENTFKEFFTFDKVLIGLFEICESLFDIVIKPRKDVSTWHKNVSFYDIYENSSDKPIAGFYLDPFSDSQNKASFQQNTWMVGIQNRNLLSNTIPLAALVFNFPGLSAKSPSLLTFKQVQLLFHKFGHALQHLLTRTTYSEVSGLSNVEWDAVEVSGHVLSHFLYNKQFLDKITDREVSPEMFDKMVKVGRNSAGIDLCRELYLSALDLELYSSKKFWLEVVKNLWPQFRAFPLDKVDSHPCSFTQIFCEDYGAAYFCHVWSRIIAADVYSAFHEVQGNDEDIRVVGKRFRETFLALGGGCHSSQIFRKFRGRDPSPKALLSSLGLKMSKARIEEKSEKT